MTATINASTSAGVVTTADTSGILQLQTNGTAALTVDASQNVGIGTASPASILELKAATPVQTFNQTTANSNQGIEYRVNGTAYGRILNNATTGILDIRNGLTGGAGYVVTFSTDGTERARIDSSGNLLIGATSYSGGVPNDSAIVIRQDGYMVTRVSGNGNYAAEFQNVSGTGVGNITVNSGSTQYVTSSDYRLKEDIAPMTGALATVAALKPVSYKWKATGEATQGFIAHELQAVVPECVVGKKDAVDADGKPQYQGIDTSFLVATLTAAIQELKAIVDAQGAEIAALKGATA